MNYGVDIWFIDALLYLIPFLIIIIIIDRVIIKDLCNVNI